jgi:hypothetical protein
MYAASRGTEAALRSVTTAMRTFGLIAALCMVSSTVAVAGVADAPRGPRGTRGVMIASSSDESPGVLDAHARKRHGEIVRGALLDVLRRSGADVRHAGIGPRQLDVAIIGWQVTTTPAEIAVSAQVRVVICDQRGRMMSIVTGRARVSVPARGARIAELREQALAEAVGSMTRSLQSQLARMTS